MPLSLGEAARRLAERHDHEEHDRYDLALASYAGQNRLNQTDLHALVRELWREMGKEPPPPPPEPRACVIYDQPVVIRKGRGSIKKGQRRYDTKGYKYEHERAAKGHLAWHVRFQHEGQTIDVGRFATEEEAREAAREARTRVLGPDVFRPRKPVRKIGPIDRSSSRYAMLVARMEKGRANSPLFADRMARKAAKEAATAKAQADERHDEGGQSAGHASTGDGDVASGDGMARIETDDADRVGRDTPAA
jgi:hypothetical protein